MGFLATPMVAISYPASSLQTDTAYRKEYARSVEDYLSRPRTYWNADLSCRFSIDRAPMSSISWYQVSVARLVSPRHTHLRAGELSAFFHALYPLLIQYFLKPSGNARSTLYGVATASIVIIPIATIESLPAKVSPRRAKFLHTNPRAQAVCPTLMPWCCYITIMHMVAIECISARYAVLLHPR